MLGSGWLCQQRSPCLYWSVWGMRREGRVQADRCSDTRRHTHKKKQQKNKNKGEEQFRTRAKSAELENIINSSPVWTGNIKKCKSGSYGKESAWFPADRWKEYFSQQVKADTVFSSLQKAENTTDESGIISPLLFPALLSLRPLQLGSSPCSTSQLHSSQAENQQNNLKMPIK